MELFGYSTVSMWPSDLTIFGSDLSGSNFTKLREIKKLSIFHYTNDPIYGKVSQTTHKFH